MCGIFGLISKEENTVNEEILNRISHRGPNNKNYFKDKTVFLGHTRLSIQDLSDNANQPMQSADGRYVLIFNGEIYNHLDIRNNYLSDISFKSSGDTETILYAYIKLGDQLFDILNGIFVIVIYDRITSELVIVRDHFGVKPLYIYSDENLFMFSSEIKIFLGMNIDKQVDYFGLFNYLTFLWSPGTTTAFAKVKKVKPGTLIKLFTNDWTQKMEYKLSYNIFNGNYFLKSELELINELDKLLNKAIERQLLSDVPVGFFLSGGLDSTLLVAIAKKKFPNRRLECFTIDLEQWSGTNEKFENDLYYAKLAASYLNVDLNIVKSDLNILKEFDRMIWHLDEPQADIAPLHVKKISELARQKDIKVLIGGTGGDDLFSGYRRHQAIKYESLFKKIPLFLRKLIKIIVSFIPNLSSFIFRLKKLLQYIDDTQENRLKGYFQWLSTPEVFNLFSEKAKMILNKYDPTYYFDDLTKEIPLEKNLLNKMLFWEINTFLVDHNLNYTDKMGMSVGVEIRVPYLDLDLVKFSQKINPELKLKNNETKYILKKVAERYLPNNIIYRSKTGFGAPVKKWITQDLDPMIKTRLSAERLLKRGIFDPQKVWDLINDNKNGKIDASYSILALLAIDSWLTQYVDN
jgi:asparagine synthase (glutamine-hydrolysing)